MLDSPNIFFSCPTTTKTDGKKPETNQWDLHRHYFANITRARFLTSTTPSQRKQFFCLSAKAIIFVRKKKKNSLLSLFTVTLTVEWSTYQKFLSFFEITFALIFWIARKITFRVMVKMRSESISFVIFNLILHRNTFNSIVFPEHGMEESPWFFLFSKVILLFPTWEIGSGASYSNDWLWH